MLGFFLGEDLKKLKLVNGIKVSYAQDKIIICGLHSLVLDHHENSL